MEKKLSKEIIVALIGAAAVILAALIALVPHLFDKNKEQDLAANLQITGLQFLDEELTDKSGKFPVITGLKPRTTTQFHYTKPSDLFVAFIFMVEGYKMKDGEKTDIDGKISIQNEDGRYLASTPIIHVANVNEWKLRPLVKRIGIENISSYINLPTKASSQIPIPYFVILDSFEQEQIPNRLGKIIISITDGFSNQTVNEELAFHVNRK